MSSPVFRLHVLPAGIGDALVIDYGCEGALQRVVIDGGVTKAARALVGYLGGDVPIELMVVTHIDNDHIAGMLKALGSLAGGIRCGEFWFNGFRHLPQSPLESMGPVEGERLTTYLVEHDVAWNTHFGGRAVMVHPSNGPPSVRLPGGLKLTVLSPGHDQLNELRKKWLTVVQEAGLDPSVPVVEEEPIPAGRLERMGGLDVEKLAAATTPIDRTEANGSSIALLAEWSDRSCLLAGDAHPDVLVASLDRWLGPGVPLHVDVFKLAHHGSKANVTNELMARVKAAAYVFSSSGEGRSQHPSDEAVARAIVHAPDDALLAFNYRNKRTEPWDDTALKTKHRYGTLYPNACDEGITVDVMSLRPTARTPGGAGERG